MLTKQPSLRIMDIKARAVLTAFTVVTLPICCIHAQDREPASGAKAPEKSNESASGAKASEKQPEKSDSQKPIKRRLRTQGQNGESNDEARHGNWRGLHQG
jgi:hypothetical protein